MEMTDGTVCDLNNEARMTKILYVCFTHGKNEVYSLKETSSCNYEVVILTQALCIHPKYRPQETGENLINCLPLDESPKRPRSLMAMEVEGLKMRYQKLAVSFKEDFLVFVWYLHVLILEVLLYFLIERLIDNLPLFRSFWYFYSNFA